MVNEETIKQGLESQFDHLKGKVVITRPRRIFMEVGRDHFAKVLEYIVTKQAFAHLCTITGLDEGEVLSFVYHLAHTGGIILNIKVSVPKNNPVIETITPIFPGAECYERELVDLLGAKVEGLPAGNRYPLTDDWPSDEFPLRKDWKPKD
ncbi:MAG: NADH-quinone oxidoreductase subunit C [Candidatus Omnitrophota bacterium]